MTTSIRFEMNGVEYEMETLSINVEREASIGYSRLAVGEGDRITVTATGITLTAQPPQFQTDAVVFEVNSELKRLHELVCAQREIIDIQNRRLRGECL